MDVPFTLAMFAALLADNITIQAKNGEADVIGGDIGGYTALYFASRYPGLVSSVFVTGCEGNYASNVYSTWTAPKTCLRVALGVILLSRSWLLQLLRKIGD